MFRNRILVTASALFIVPLLGFAAPTATTATQKPEMRAILSKTKTVRDEAVALKTELDSKTPAASKVKQNIQTLQRDASNLSTIVSDFSSHQTAVTKEQKKELSDMTVTAQVINALMKGETQWADQGVAKNRKMLRANAEGIEQRTRTIDKDASSLNL
jgi:hypothetical protein